MFDHKHYIPILKTKAGERWAIDHLEPSVKRQLTPLFEIHPHASRDVARHAGEMCEEIASAWGTEPFFLDTFWLHPRGGDPSVIQDVFNSARTSGLQAIPVVRVTYDQFSLDVIRTIVGQDGRGCMLRLTQDALGQTAAIEGVLRALGMARQSVHLLTDYRNHPMTLAGDVPQITAIADWLTFSAASGLFPGGLSSLPLFTWQNFARNDWLSWESDVVNAGLARKPAFSDYTIRDPGPPAEFGSPSACLRYTRGNRWMVQLGRKLQDGYAQDMYQLCQSLLATGEFDGAMFSAGDAVINDMATGNTAGPGAAQQWLQWAINHHMTFVVRQIASHTAL